MADHFGGWEGHPAGIPEVGPPREGRNGRSGRSVAGPAFSVAHLRSQWRRAAVSIPSIEDCTYDTVERPRGTIYRMYLDHEGEHAEAHWTLTPKSIMVSWIGLSDGLQRRGFGQAMLTAIQSRHPGLTLRLIEPNEKSRGMFQKWRTARTAARYVFHVEWAAGKDALKDKQIEYSKIVVDHPAGDALGARLQAEDMLLAQGRELFRITHVEDEYRE